MLGARMVRTAVIICLLLTGCDDFPRARSESEIREISRTVGRDDIAQLQVKIIELESEIRDLKADNEWQDKWISKTLDGAADLEKRVNRNADISNQNAVKEMTRRGACGTRPKYNYREDGAVSSMVIEKIPCTIDDLK